jgi:hypothetical protein
MFCVRHFTGITAIWVGRRMNIGFSQVGNVHNSGVIGCHFCDKIAGYFLTTEHAINMLHPTRQVQNLM